MIIRVVCLTPRRGQMTAQKWIAESPTWHVERWSYHPYGKLQFKI